MYRFVRPVPVAALLAAAACGSSNHTSTPTTPTPAPTPTPPSITLSAPTPIGPLSGTTVTPRPTFRVSNTTKTGNAGAITYLFEASDSSAFSNIVFSATNTEGVNETGYIVDKDLPVGALYWRATAKDATNNVSSSASAVQTITVRAWTQAETIANQLGVVLWPGTQPPGDPGHATMGTPGFFGVGWQPQTLFYSVSGVSFQSPDIEQLRYFDLWDRGMDPANSTAWMKANGYPTDALWYPGPEKAVMGFKYVYIAARGKVTSNGTWDIVVRLE